MKWDMTFKHMHEQDIIQLCKDQIEHVNDAGQTRMFRRATQPMKLEGRFWQK